MIVQQMGALGKNCSRAQIQTKIRVDMQSFCKLDILLSLVKNYYFQESYGNIEVLQNNFYVPVLCWVSQTNVTANCGRRIFLFVTLKKGDFHSLSENTIKWNILTHFLLIVTFSEKGQIYSIWWIKLARTLGFMEDSYKTPNNKLPFLF